MTKIDICSFRAYQRSFRLFQSDFSTDIHQRSRFLCFTQNDHTGQTGFKICPFLKWAQSFTFHSPYFFLFLFFIENPRISWQFQQKSVSSQQTLLWGRSLATPYFLISFVSSIFLFLSLIRVRKNARLVLKNGFMYWNIWKYWKDCLLRHRRRYSII